MREYFMKTERILFSKWTKTDLDLARLLWGDPDVTRFISASGRFTESEIESRLNLEIQNGQDFQVQYWPIFDKQDEELIGCCGLRPFKNESNAFEIGFHLRKKYWGKGYAKEAASQVISYAFNECKASSIYAGHHPKNEASGKILKKLGFSYIGDNYYEPTGLYHPSYVSSPNRCGC